MPARIPTICGHCKALLLLPIELGGPGASVQIGPGNVVRCQVCGKSSVVPEGTWAMETEHLLRTSSRETLEGLRELLRRFDPASQATAADLATAIEVEVPRSGPIVRMLRSQQNRMEIGMWITVLLALVTFVLSAQQGSATPSVDVTVNVDTDRNVNLDVGQPVGGTGPQESANE